MNLTHCLWLWLNSFVYNSCIWNKATLHKPYTQIHWVQCVNHYCYKGSRLYEANSHSVIAVPSDFYSNGNSACVGCIAALLKSNHYCVRVHLISKSVETDNDYKKSGEQSVEFASTWNGCYRNTSPPKKLNINNIMWTHQRVHICIITICTREKYA